jgi:protein O-mannosyl-transferase
MSVSQALRLGLIVLLGTFVYLNSLSGPFLFDDQSSILTNPRIRTLWPPVDVLAPLSNSALASRPIVNLSFGINYAIGGISVRGYHVGNVAIHIAASLVLFLLVRMALTGAALRDRFFTHADGLAMSVALIWMVHPLQTEAVNYVTQRTELLMGLCYLLTLFCSIRALRSEVPERWHLAAIASCLIGAGSKETIATVPLVVILYDLVFEFRSLKDALRRRRLLYAGLAMSWVALAVMASSRNGTAGFGAGISIWTYLLNQAVMITQYLKLTIWPSDLVLDYGVPLSLSLSDVLPQALFVVMLLMATIAALVWRPMAGFCAAWFFITLAPTSSFIPIVTEVGAERRMYLPLAGIVVLAVTGAYSLATRTRITVLRPAMAVTVCAILVWLAAGTMKRNDEYASARVVLETSLARWPHGRVRFNLAHVLKAEGRRDEALAQLRAAVPDNPQAHYLLASDLYDRGEFNEAVKELRALIKRTELLRSDNVAARNLLGLALAQQEQFGSAITVLQEALAMAPENADLHGNLAFLFLQQRQFDRAREHYEAYLTHRQGNAFILTSLGTTFAQLGRFDDARKAYRDALRLDPTYAEAHARLGALESAQPAIGPP